MGKKTWASWVIYTFETLELSRAYASGKTYIHIQIHSRDNRTPLPAALGNSEPTSVCQQCARVFSQWVHFLLTITMYNYLLYIYVYIIKIFRTCK